jgi:outer membrane protein assembly factor BamB
MKINRSSPLVAFVLLGLALAPSIALSQPCRLVEMKVDGQTAEAAGVSVDLGEASPPDATSVTAFQGPPRITVGGGATCSASQDVSLIFGKPWLGGGKLFLSTYSGSENRVYALDVHSCRIVWKSPVFEGSPATYRNGQLVTGTRRIRLNRSCMPSY